ncbi:MAG: hypothetical protein GTN74_13025 [Proteobacteria bacterium]|nr:hypothetical protein [Pseudomonadota bacterium]NIS71350.1 hypothetical protein [Pseudomonadota bacterium]
MGPLFYIILPATFVGLAIPFVIPISLRFDSTQRFFGVRWMGISFTKILARKRLKPPKEVPVIREKIGKPKEKPEKKKREKIRAGGELLLKERELTFELLQKGYRSILDLVRSVSIRELEGSFSTSDPMWNGVLAGMLTHIHVKNVNLSANFQNVNYVRGSLQVRPYRLVKIAAGLLIHLPCRKIIKTLLSIRSSSERRNHRGKCA